MARTATRRPLDEYASRRRALVRLLAQEGVDAFLATRPNEVGYLCPFAGETGALVVGRGWAVLITDAIHAEQAAKHCPGIDVRVGSSLKLLAPLRREKAFKRLGACSDHVTLSAWLRLQDAVGPRRLQATEDVVAELRLVKSDRELRVMARAVNAAETALMALMKRGRKGFVGRTERAVAGELDYLMRQAGAEGPAFDTIVASGAGSSQPHYRPTGRKIRPDQIVLIDWGAKVDGYCSDLTRVLLTGRISPQLAQVYEVVHRAQAAAFKAVRPRVAAGKVDTAARDVIADAGYREQFVHSVGHGLGRQVHEGPPLTGANVERLRAGMVVTVEPGIYLPGVGGVRLEDDVVVTTNGSRKLSHLPTDIRQMKLR